MLQDRIGVSEQRASRYVRQPRSTQRREPVVAEDDAALRAELLAFSRKRPRWGIAKRIITWPSRAGL
jgi:hypothetical protein